MTRYYFDIITSNGIKKIYVDTVYKEIWMIRQELKAIYKNAIIACTKNERI